MTATILTENPLPGLSSASGIEIIGPTAYVIGDDSPLLYLLDAANWACWRVKGINQTGQGVDISTSVLWIIRKGGEVKTVKYL